MSGILYCDFSLCFPSLSGLNGFNMLLPGAQTPHTVAPSPAQLPSFGVPCMFLPSPGLGPFPVLYSPAIPGPISSAPGTHPNPEPMNFGLSTLASASHLLISPAAMVNPKPSTLPCADPQIRCQPSLNLSPVMPGSQGIVHPESTGYMRHPVSMVKTEQVRPEAPLFHGGVHLHTVSFPPRRLTGMERYYIRFYLVFNVNPVLTAYSTKHWAPSAVMLSDKFSLCQPASLSQQQREPYGYRRSLSLGCLPGGHLLRKPFQVSSTRSSQHPPFLKTQPGS